MEYFIRLRVLNRIKQLFTDKNLATYKLQKETIILKLNEYFWDRGKGLKGFWNRLIYKKAVTQLKDVIKTKRHTIESCRNNLKEILDSRSEEIVNHLINEELLISDNDNPPSYYIKSIKILTFLWLFKWVIVNVLILGLIVAVIANLIASFLWKKISPN
jgi:hypothetical protein